MGHTPGPWEATGQLIYEQEGGSRSVAIVQLAPHATTTEANAALIAASPDLLAACEAAYATKFWKHVDDDGDAAGMLRAAIAKATPDATT